MRLVEARVRDHVDGLAERVFSDEADIHGREPSSDRHILELKPCARISRIAPDDTRGEHTAMHLNITHDNVPHGDSRVNIALSNQRVEHAAGPATTWLGLLLGADVYAPPEGILHLETIV